MYLTPYILAFLISLSVAAIAWRRKVLVGRTFAILALAQTSVILGYIFELVSQTLGGKLFWDDFQWGGILLWAYLMPIFAFQLTGSEKAKQSWIRWVLAIVPTVMVVLLLTNNLHGWVHHDAWLVYGNHFNTLVYDFTPVVWGFTVYAYLFIILAFAYLLVKYFQMHRIYRNQIGAVVLGSAIPLIGYALTLFGVTLSFHRDIAPLTITLGNIVILWGLTRQHLFDLIPIARDIVIDNIEDIVVVVDESDRIVDLNQPAKDHFLTDGRPAIGLKVKDFFFGSKEYSEQEGRLKAEGHVEQVFKHNGKDKYVDIRITKIEDRNHDLGYVFVARDITTQKEYEQEILTLNTELEQRVQRRTKALEEAYESTLEGWAKALELRDKETEGHSRRVTELAFRLGGELSLSSEDLVDIRRGALIHDIGKMGIPDAILHKPGPLSPEEWKIMKQHPRIGFDLLAHIPFLENANKITCAHHERWDGAGYPSQMAGEEIPLFARIFTVIDNWDALLSDRPYRKAWEKENVIEYLRENRGTIFDPKVLDVFFEMMSLDL